MQQTRNFKPQEFMCPCCNKEYMNLEFITLLQLARTLADIPFNINSGWRCKQHNKDVGGSPTSSHLIGHAADIEANGNNKRFVIISALLNVGFKRIGIASTFIHVDNDSTGLKNEKLIWLYK